MSNSPLATYIDTSTGNWNYRPSPTISRITIHHAAGIASMETFSAILRSGRECSWNYAIANDGTIGLFVDESHRAWTSSSAANDNIAVTIEVSNSEVGGNWPVSDAAYESILKLCTDICRRNNITKLTYTGQLSGSNLTMHQWFASTACPGEYLKSKFPSIAATVNARLASGSDDSEIITDNAYSNAMTGIIDRSQINYKYLTPYIITMSRTFKNVDIKSLKNKGVVGVIIEAGYLYDVVHKEVPYRNPQLTPIYELCKSNELSVGLYCHVKARNVNEAKKELYYLSLCIRTVPPLLGMWLKLELTGSKDTNHKIIDTYYDTLVKLGLKGKVGFYVTPEELSKIDWKSYCDKWYLWMIKPIQSLSDIDQLLVPQFFMLEGV